MHSAAAQATLLERVWPDAGNRALRAAVLIGAGSLLLAVSAKVQVPMWPVPMTMQTFAVLLIGMTYGLRLGAAAVAAYLVQGALGLPVFAGPLAGLGYMAGPTGGFLVGFLLAAAAMGWMVERGWGRGLGRAVVVLAVGTVVPFVTGVAWLAALIGPERALMLGLVPFLAGAAVKLALALAVLAAGERAVGRG